MELRDFLRLVFKYSKIALSLSILCSLIGVLIVFKFPPKYKAEGTVYVVRGVAEENSAFFGYEGYYASQTAERFTDTVIGLLKAADIRKLALAKLNLSAEKKDIAKLDKNIFVKKTAPNLIYYSVVTPSSSDSSAKWLALASVVSETVDSLNTKGDEKIATAPVVERPIVYELKPNFLLVGVGLLAGLYVVFLTAFIFKDYMKGSF